MSQPTLICPRCGAPLLATSRFCPRCDTPIAPSALAHDEVFLPGTRRLRVGADSLSLTELMAMVEAGQAWLRQKLQSADAVTRDQAARALKDLSQVLDSLSQQLAQGRDTERITQRFPTPRIYAVGCPVCGRGNRIGARFCQTCGAPLTDAPAVGASASEPSVRVTTASKTDVGQAREKNEDTCYVGPLSVGGGSATLCLVADGMGGAVAGEQASRMASETVQAELQAALKRDVPTSDEAWQALLKTCATKANQNVYTHARANPERKGMGTTLTLLVLIGMRAHLAHVGDSRAYLINATGATEEGTPSLQLTGDHTLVARLVDIGQLTPEQARTHPQRSMLYRAIGTDPQVEVDTGSYAIQPGDFALVCSDGLVNYLEDAELAQIVLKTPDIQAACDQLVQLANTRGGRDNISVVLAKIESSYASLPSVRS